MYYLGMYLSEIPLKHVIYPSVHVACIIHVVNSVFMRLVALFVFNSYLCLDNEKLFAHYKNTSVIKFLTLFSSNIQPIKNAQSAKENTFFQIKK